MTDAFVLHAMQDLRQPARQLRDGMPDVIDERFSAVTWLPVSVIDCGVFLLIRLVPT
jgi:hypothetical protein